MRRWRVIALAGLVAGLLAAGSAARAQDGSGATPQPGGGSITDDQVNAVASQLFCPVCQNVPLDVCGTQACADWRGEIRTMLAEGKSQQDIKDYFASRYGERVLATPEARGLNALVWVLPILGVIAGLAIVVFALRRMAPGALAAEVSGSDAHYDDLDPEYVARLEKDLREMNE